MSMFDELAAPFPPERVSWRVGSVKKDGTAAMALAYLDARDVMERLDAVCGPAGWQNRYSHVGGVTVCEIGIRSTLAQMKADATGGLTMAVPSEWLWKADGAGATDIEAEKGALSDAFKRAAVRWGIGRYLYDLESPWVQIDQWKKILPAEMKKLEAILRRQAPSRGISPAPDGPDFPGAEGSPGRSAYAAKKDGGSERFIQLQDEIAALEDAAAVGAFIAARQDEIKTFPEGWRKVLREKIDDQRHFLADLAAEG